MADTFLIYVNKLRQWVPSLSPEQAEDFVNDAWRDIREANDQWSFLLAQEYWLAPGSISLTNIGATQFSSTITLTYAPLLAIGGLNNPPLTQRQLRFGLSGGPIYEISSSNVLQVTTGSMSSGSATLTIGSPTFTSAMVGQLLIVNGAGIGGVNLNTTISSFISPTQVILSNTAANNITNGTITWGSTITLSRPYNETTNSNASALLYRIYYSPLTTNFQRVDHLVDPITGYEFGWDINPIDLLDRVDPQRATVREPYQVFLHHFNQTTGLPVYELWPGPTVQRAYTVTFWQLGLPFVNDGDTLPIQITSEMLLLRARYLAYEWGEVNDPDPRKRADYRAAKTYAKSKYSTEGQPGRPLGLLDIAMRRDEELSAAGRQRPRRPGPGWPMDSNFSQRHAIPSWWGGFPG